MKFIILQVISLLIILNVFSQERKISGIVTEKLITIQNANTTLRINTGFQFELLFENDGKSSAVTTVNKNSPSVFLSDSGNKKISFIRKAAQVFDVHDKFGKGKTIKVKGTSPDGRIGCDILFSTYQQFPNVILVQSSFKNISTKNLTVKNYTIDHLSLNATPQENKWWSFQGASYYWAQDFAFELPSSFTRENYMGLNDTRVGSGIPLVDVWNKKFGVALAYIGEKPRDIYMPVTAENGDVRFAIKEDNKSTVLKPNEGFVSPQTAIIVHNNDFYDPLKIYSRLMKSFLPEFKKPASYSFEPEWCTWGYRQNFTPEQVLGKIDRVKQLGMKSIILDDGWAPNHGDWIPDPVKFPKGDEDFKKLINKIHENGLKVWIWWLPGYVDSLSKVATQHADWLVKNKDGSVHPSYALCPAYKPVQEHYKKLVQKFAAEYKLDGLKLDFQEINSAPPCYNPAHHHKDPYDSYYSTPGLFKNIYQTAVKYNPDMLVEYCSCGIPPSIFHLPWVNLAVTSDPGIQQITQRIKMYKALMGNDFPVLEEYCGVLAGPLYPLTIGAGGVPGTFATLLDDYHEKWLNIYQKNQLSKGGEYLNLYDIGFDYPEAHVIKKDRKIYYAFYTHPWGKLKPTDRFYRYGSEFDYTLEGKNEFKFPAENYSGKIEMRGLDKGREYRVVDYANNKELGIIKGDKPYLKVSFDDYLLLEVSPLK